MKTASPSPAGATRRDFLKTSSTVVAGTVLTGSLGARAWAANSDTLKVGLIGCGGRGTGAAGQALKADKNVVLTAVGDVFEEACKSALNSLRNNAEIRDRVQVTPDHIFTGLDNFQKVIDSGVDVVLLASPPGFRPQHLRAAVAAGKHVFCEKPMATDPPGVRSVMVTSTRFGQKRQMTASRTQSICFREVWRSWRGMR